MQGSNKTDGRTMWLRITGKRTISGRSLPFESVFSMVSCGERIANDEPAAGDQRSSSGAFNKAPADGQHGDLGGKCDNVYRQAACMRAASSSCTSARDGDFASGMGGGARTK